MLFLTILFLCPSLVLLQGGFLTCPQSGYKKCSSSDTSFTISTSLTLSNCIYDSCPQLNIIGGASVTINNVVFMNSDNSGGRGTSNGGCIYVTGTTTQLQITNSHFINCSATGDGGAIFVGGPLGSALTISNSLFQGNRAVTSGGAIRLLSAIDLVLTNVRLFDNFAYNGGGVFGGSGSITVTGGSCFRSNSSNFGGCFFTAGGSSFVMSNYDAGDCTAGTTGSVIMINGDTPIFTINDSTFSRCSDPLYLYGSTTRFGINSTNLLLQDCTGVGILNYCGPLVMNNLRILRHVGTTFSSPVQGVITTFINCTFQGAIGSGLGPVQVQGGLRAYNTSFTNNTFPGSGGILNIMQSTSLYCKGCRILDNMGINGGGIALMGLNTVYLEDTILDGNIATADGGAIFVDKPVFFALGPNVIIRNNRANRGGGIFWAGTTNLTINGTGISVTNNTAAVIKFSNSIYHASSCAYGFFSGLLTGGSYFDGGVFIYNSVTANGILSNTMQANFFAVNGGNAGFYAGQACSVSITNSNQLFGAGNLNYAMNLFISQKRLPTLYITATDYFGNVAQINYTSLVVIYVSERSVTLQGESTKAVIDPLNNPIPFYDLAIPNPSPSTYTLTIRASGLVAFPNSVKNLTVQVNYLQCDPVAERFISTLNQCVPAMPMNVASVQIISIVAVIGIGLVALVIVYSFVGLKEGIVPFTGTFIRLLGFGSIISLLALVPYLNRCNGSSCMISAWIENIGYSIIMASTISRIIFIKDFSKASQNGGNYPATYVIQYLSKALGVSLVFFVVLLLIWSFLQPSVQNEILLPATGVVITDACSKNAFTSIIVMARFIVSVGASVVAYNARNVQFNGLIRVLIIFTYNWVIFGSLMSIIGDLLVSDPNVSFVIYGIALIFPNVVGTLLVIAYPLIGAPESFHSSSKKGHLSISVPSDPRVKLSAPADDSLSKNASNAKSASRSITNGTGYGSHA